MGSAWVEAGVAQDTQSPPASYRVWGEGGGEGEARVTVLALHTTWMHVDLSFSYLRFAEAASFDKKRTAQQRWSNGNDIKTKAERSFNLDFVFDNIEAKGTCLFQNL